MMLCHCHSLGLVCVMCVSQRARKAKVWMAKRHRLVDTGAISWNVIVIGLLEHTLINQTPPSTQQAHKQAKSSKHVCESHPEMGHDAGAFSVPSPFHSVHHSVCFCCVVVVVCQ